MSEPTIEEMRDAVLAVYPECDIFYAGDGTFCILPNRDVSFPDRISGWAESKDVAWRYAYRRLPVNAAPEKVCPSCKCTPHGGSCIQGAPLLTRAEQAAPESEDEAFERAFNVFNKTLSFTATPTEKIIFREGYNARARRDVEMGK